MQDPYPIPSLSRPLFGRIRPPGSKSLTNRALIVGAMAAGKTTLSGALNSVDTRVMLDSLQQLGLSVEHEKQGGVIAILGGGGMIPASSADLRLENSGTSIRFLTAFCTLGNGTFRLDGNERMRQRPIGDLVRALNAIGADVRCDAENDCPPLTVVAAGLAGGRAAVAGSISSQYLSALLMTAPCAQETAEIHVEGTLVSRPYVDMTLDVMAQFGVDANEVEEGTFVIEPQVYEPRDYEIEPDASAASYFFAAAAVTGGRVTVEGLTKMSLQGDMGFLEVLERMGCTIEWSPDGVTVTGGPLRGVDVDMNFISDTSQTLAAVAPFADGPTHIRNIAHVRHKETDRIAAVVTELRKLGLEVEEHDDGMTIFPGPMQPAIIDTYDDHRMAMSFAILGLRHEGVQIADPGCTSKTYPDFFDDLKRLCEAAE
jgi:3-phosphoshikimate 1-carboxyvinyltransferase